MIMDHEKSEFPDVWRPSIHVSFPDCPTLYGNSCRQEVWLEISSQPLAQINFFERLGSVHYSVK